MRKDNSKYEPIDCNYYDEITLLILHKRECEVLFYNEKAEEQVVTAIIEDVYTRKKAEYLRLKDGTEIRLDKIIALDDKKNPDKHSNNCKV